MNLGKNIKKFRILKNMTQEDLANLLNTTSKSVSRWESETTYPDIVMLPLLANIFEITVDELLDVEEVKQDEYIERLKKQAFEYQKNNDVENELKLWQEAHRKFPNNEEIKICFISIMTTINVVTNEIRFSSEIIKLAESILKKSTNNLIRIDATQALVDLYSQMDNIELADLYCKKLPRNFFNTYDVMKTRYLRKDELLLAIQKNISAFTNEIVRESEWVIHNNRMNLSDEYKKEFLERLVRIEELVFIEEEDYGYEAIPIIFNYIHLAKLEIRTTNHQATILEYFNKLNKPLKYIANFKPHMCKSPFINKLKCEHIGGYSCVLFDLKNNILKELTDSIFNAYKNELAFKIVIDNIEKM